MDPYTKILHTDPNPDPELRKKIQFKFFPHNQNCLSRPFLTFPAPDKYRLRLLLLLLVLLLVLVLLLLFIFYSRVGEGVKVGIGVGAGAGQKTAPAPPKNPSSGKPVQSSTFQNKTIFF